MSDQITVTRTVHATPQQLFALLSDPGRHPEIDGSEMLRGVEGASSITGTGDEFVMNMRNDLLGAYQIANTVTAYEQDRKIGWAPSLHPIDGYTDKLGDTRVEGHTFTWELTPEGGGTAVTQTYDWSGVRDDGFRGLLPLLTEQQLADSIEKAGRAAAS